VIVDRGVGGGEFLESFHVLNFAIARSFTCQKFYALVRFRNRVLDLETGTVRDQ